VSVPDFSVELCGGTHVRATGDIGVLLIESESGIAAGVRRVEALTGAAALQYAQDLRATIAGVVAHHVDPTKLGETIEKLQAETKRLTRELQQARMKAAMGSDTGVASHSKVEDVIVIARAVSGLDKDGLRALVDQHRSRMKTGIVILAQESNGKGTLTVGVTPDLEKKLPAGQVTTDLALIIDGRGGGRGDFAEAGGKDPSKIGALIRIAPDVVEIRYTGKDVQPVPPPTASWGRQAMNAVRRWLELRGTVTDAPKTGYMVVQQPDGVAVNVEVRLIHNQAIADRKMRDAIDGAVERHAMPYMLVLVARVAPPARAIKPILDRALESNPLRDDSVEVYIGFLEDDARFTLEGRVWPSG
jgi:hypothetical protein